MVTTSIEDTNKKQLVGGERLVDGIFDHLTCKPKLTIKESNDQDYVDLETIFDTDVNPQKLTLQISKSLRLPCDAPSMTGATLVSYIWGYENGIWKPVSLTIPYGNNYIRLKDTTANHGGNFGDLALVTMSDRDYDPILTWSQGMVVKKDFSAGGFVSANQGLIALGSGMKNQFDPPGAWLFQSETHALHDIATLSSPPGSPQNNQYYINSGNSRLYQWNGSTWVDKGHTSSYNYMFDTFYIRRAAYSVHVPPNTPGIPIDDSDLGNLACNIVNALKIQFGTDTNLFRDSANVLKTDDSLIVSQNLWCDALAVNTSAGITGALSASSISSSGVIHGGGSSGDAFKVGDDIYIVDVNNANRLSLQGAQSRTQAGIQFGSGGMWLYRDSAYLRCSSGLIVDGYIVAASWANTTQYGPLYRNASGQIGYNTSALRFKDNISDEEDCSWLYKLRPVTFDWKDQQRKQEEGRQLGLIAEEVNELYPQLVFHDSEGKPEGVHYEWLGVPLIVEMKKLRSRVEALENQLKQNQVAA